MTIKKQTSMNNGSNLARVLIVDDEPMNIDVLEQELDGMALELISASNGKEALECLADSPVDMILLDLMMPVMDGFGVLEALAANDEWRDIPVVIISAADDLTNMIRGIEMGASDFLPKPFEPAILRARLNAGLEKKRYRDLEQRYIKSLEREMEIGREIQAGFLPKHIPEVEGWKIQAYFKAAREVAGDFYDVFKVDTGKVGLLLGDVTDKGVGSAMYMALYRTLLRSSMLADTFSEDLEEVACSTPEACLLQAVRLANRYIYTLHDSVMLATIFFGILNTETGELCYVNAGHDPPYVVRGSKILMQVGTTGPIVGAIEDAGYEIQTLHLEPGDTLVLYSDGIPDSLDETGERYGSDQFQKLLQAENRPPGKLFAELISSVDAHIGGADQFDDITLLMVSRG